MRICTQSISVSNISLLSKQQCQKWRRCYIFAQLMWMIFMRRRHGAASSGDWNLKDFNNSPSVQFSAFIRHSTQLTFSNAPQDGLRPTQMRYFCERGHFGCKISITSLPESTPHRLRHHRVPWFPESGSDSLLG